MAWIFVDKEEESGGMEKMRQQMRRNMRGGGYRTGGNYRGGSDGSGNYRDGSDGSGNYRDGYRQGYKHGWEDHEEDWMDDDEVMYRRRRDSRGRYM